MGMGLIYCCYMPIPFKKKKKKLKIKKSTKEIRYLEKLIEYSTKGIDGKSDSIDELFAKQVCKLRDQINKLEEKQ